MKQSPLRALFALVALLACAGTPLAGGAADPYDVYVLLPLTGSVSFYAGSQQQVFRAIEAFVNRHGGIKGRPLHFVIQDDQSNPQVDVQLANEIFAKNVPVMLGPTNTAQCGAVAPLVKNGPVIWCFTPGYHPPAGSYVFTTGASTADLMAVIFRYLNERGLRRVATITSTDASGQDGDRAVDAALEREKAVTLVDREHFTPTDVSVAAQLAKIKATAPQALLVWTTGTPFGTILRGVQQAGLDVPVITTNGNLTRAQMTQYAGILPKELLFPGAAFLAPELFKDKAEREAIDTLYAGLRAQNAKPDWGHNNCWDPTLIVVNALRKYGPAATAQQIHDYIADLKGFDGINGPYDFEAEPQHGLGSDDVLIVRWDQAKGDWVAASNVGGALLRR